MEKQLQTNLNIPKPNKILASTLLSSVLALSSSTRAKAQEATVEEPKKEQKPTAIINYGIESQYAYNFKKPGSRGNQFLAFVNPHNSFSISNIYLGISHEEKLENSDKVAGKLTIQEGETPRVYNSNSNYDIYPIIQEANLSYTNSKLNDLTLSVGTFLAPGFESMAKASNYNYSNSNLFFGLPFDFTGAKIILPIGNHKLTAWAINGWNYNKDNNSQKSGIAQWEYDNQKGFSAYLALVAGTERDAGSQEGSPIRAFIDGGIKYIASKNAEGYLQLNYGREKNNFGLQHWQAAQLATKFTLFSDESNSRSIFLAPRADIFRETAPAGATNIFFPTDLITSQTLTLGFSAGAATFRLEGRHDYSPNQNIFYKNNPAADASPNATSQINLIAGFTYAK